MLPGGPSRIVSKTKVSNSRPRTECEKEGGSGEAVGKVPRAVLENRDILFPVSFLTAI